MRSAAQRDPRRLPRGLHTPPTTVWKQAPPLLTFQSFGPRLFSHCFSAVAFNPSLYSPSALFDCSTLLHVLKRGNDGFSNSSVISSYSFLGARQCFLEADLHATSSGEDSHSPWLPWHRKPRRNMYIEHSDCRFLSPWLP